jgi:hypothetical protein
MDKIGLRKEVLDEIKSDPILHGKVAQSLGFSPMSMAKLIYTNDPRLTQASAMAVLRKHLKKQDKELLCELTGV